LANRSSGGARPKVVREGVKTPSIWSKRCEMTDVPNPCIAVLRAASERREKQNVAH
jgi:hypothetical protein